MNDTGLDERARHTLQSLISLYIEEGQPVGSKTLVQQAELGISAASVRNVMAELEDAGYLHSPHTSAGRVPTAQGYRLFVDDLLMTSDVAEGSVGALPKDGDVSALLESTSTVLSDMTQLVGLVTVPHRQKLVLSQIEFLSLSESRLLVILVLQNGEVFNQVIQSPRLFSPAELTQAGNYLTSMCAQKELSEVRSVLIAAMQQDQAMIQAMMKAVVETTEKASSQYQPDNYVMSGQSHLIDSAHVSGVDQLRSLFDIFSQKRDLLNLLDQCLGAERVKIFIGQESGCDVFEEYSLVTAPYKVDDQPVGVLAVVGPTRMPYERAISVVQLSAQMLSDALQSD